MPNLFSVSPVIEPQYFKTSKKIPSESDLENYLPSPQFDKMKNTLKSLTVKIKQFQDESKNQNQDVSMIQTTDKYIPLYIKLNKTLEESSDVLQHMMNLRTKLNFLHLRYNSNDKDTSKFTEWYMKELYNQLDQNEYEITLDFSKKKLLFDNQNETKESIINYQNQIIDNLTKWIDFLNSKINEITKEVQMITTNLSKENRTVSMEYETITKKDVFKENLVTFFFFSFYTCIILIIFFHLIIPYLIKSKFL